MSNARNLADLLDSNGDVVSGALDNVPPSNDASALTTGTLPIARIADGDVTTAKLASTLDLSGKTVTYGLTGSDMPAGAVLQVVQVRNTSDTRIYSTVVDFLSASITPSSTSSKILVMGNLASVARRETGNSEGLYWLVRGATSLGTFDGITPWNDGATNQRSVGSIHVQYLDSPNTTSSTTYYLRVNCAGTSVDINDEGGISSLTLMEIAG